MNLQELLEQCGYETCSHAGRYIEGKECLGVIFDGNPTSMLADIIVDCLDVADEDDQKTILECAKAFKNMRTEHLGRDTYIYFPSIEYVESDDEY